MRATTLPTSQAARAALDELDQALGRLTATTPLGIWRWSVLESMMTARGLLVDESAMPDDWLADRRSTAMRERNALLDRMSALRLRVIADRDVDQVAHELRRLVVDVRHHLQRVHDLAYDTVSEEVGGSE